MTGRLSGYNCFIEKSCSVASIVGGPSVFPKIDCAEGDSDVVCSVNIFCLLVPLIISCELMEELGLILSCYFILNSSNISCVQFRTYKESDGGCHTTLYHNSQQTSTE